MKKTITTSVRIPAEWLKISINDIMIIVTAVINDQEDYVNITVIEIQFPGYHSLNILPQFHSDFYELVEQKCMDSFTQKIEDNYDYETYPDYVL